MRSALLAAAAFLLAGPALADVKAGVDAWGRGDYRKAVEEWRGPAVAGDADAQFNLGQAYKLGRGVPVDPQMAESWFRKAALQGHEQAGDNYALSLFQGGRKSEAVPWLEKSVARDEPRTELVYGTMLFNGDGVPRDYPRAYALMTRAAAARPGKDGLSSARETLAQMDGYISPQDRERGTALAQQYALAAENRVAATPGPNRVSDQPPVRTADATPAPPPTPRAGKPPRAEPAPRPAKPPRADKPVASANTVTREANGDVSIRVPHPRVAPLTGKPSPARPAPVAASPRGGTWRVQLGAFRDRGNAEALWSRVRARTGGSPAYVAAGGLTRLQVTGFASKADAQAACRKAGTPCNVVAP